MRHLLSDSLRLGGLSLDFARSHADREQIGAAVALFFRDALGRPASGGARAAVEAIAKGADPAHAARQLARLTDTALLIGPEEGKLTILRGGASKTRLFLAALENAVYVWDRLPRAAPGLIPRRDLIAFTIAHTLFGPFEPRATLETALAGVLRAPTASVVQARLVSGRLEVTRAEIVHDDLAGTPTALGEAADALRGEVDATITEALEALPAGTPIAFEVSGGLDSSIVALRAKALAGLRSVPMPRFGVSICYPYYEFRREAGFIDAAYAALAMPRVTLDGATLVPFERWGDAPVHDEPNLAIVGLAQHEAVLAAAAKRGARLLFNGFGGDTIFGMGPANQFRVPAPPPRPDWIGKAGWACTLTHWEGVRAFFRAGEESYHRQFFSGAYIEDGWADIHLSPRFGCTRVCAFTRANILRLAARLWAAAQGGPPYKRILRDVYRAELPAAIATRTHKTAYDGLYVRGYRRRRGELAAQIRRHADRLAAEGISPERLIQAVDRIAGGRLDGDLQVSAVLAALAWLDAREVGAQ